MDVWFIAPSDAARREVEQRLRGSAVRPRYVEREAVIEDRLSSMMRVCAGIAHQVNNPLAYVVSNLGFLVESLGDDAATTRREELAQAAADALHGAGRVRDIIRDLRLLSGAPAPGRRRIDVVETARRVLRLIAGEALLGAQLTTHFEAVPPIWASEEELGQVLLLLLSNAAQAVPARPGEASEISLSTFEEAGRAVIEVHDLGAGIPDDWVPRAFDPFFTLRPSGEGGGLGLSICHALVRRLGGSISVHRPPGGGSSFRVVLAAAPDAGR